MAILDDAVPIGFLAAAERGRARDFYRDTLGLPLEVSDDFGDQFRCGGGRLRITALPDFSPSPHPVFGFHVADLAATIRGLREKGVAMLVYDGFGQDADGIWTAPDQKMRLAWFNDPEGNVLSLSEG